MVSSSIVAFPLVFALPLNLSSSSASYSSSFVFFVPFVSKSESRVIRFDHVLFAFIGVHWRPISAPAARRSLLNSPAFGRNHTVGIAR
jgi:hypothetical protein